MKSRYVIKKEISQLKRMRDMEKYHSKKTEIDGIIHALEWVLL